MRKKLMLAVACAALAASAAAQSDRFDAGSYLRHVRHLAGDDLKGRANGSPELNKAADYIAKEFRAAGLAPGGSDGWYFQEFETVTGSELGPKNRLTIRAGTRSIQAALRKEYVPIGTDGATQLSGPVVFAGYGITAEEHGYDDYKDLDVADKVVLVLAHEPLENDNASPFDGKIMTLHGQDSTKAFNAKSRQAKAILIVQDPANHPDEENDLSDPTLGTQVEDLGIAAFRIHRSLAQKILAAGKKDLIELQREIDGALAPRSFALSGIEIQISLDVKKVRREVRNVVGILQGTDPAAADEAIVIGAHYDHLGRGNRSSMERSQIGQVHNGADDNASGTAGIIELARALARDPAARRRTLIFIAFAAEELGLNGSAYWVAHPNRPVDKIVAMLNLDMIGRLKDNVILVNGIATSPSFEPLVAGASADAGLTLKPFPGGFGGSDQQSFYLKDIPVLFFFTGYHADYHRPSDDWDKIDSAGAVRVLDMVYRVATRLNEMDNRPGFAKIVEPAAPPGGGRGYGAYFGSVPDMTGDVAGVRFSEVRPDSPAASAGLRANDVLIRFGGKEIRNLQDFSYMLQARKPGETVEVVVVREGQSLTVQVTLGMRR